MTAARLDEDARKAYLDYRARCQQVFAPFAPIELPDFFAGRKSETRRLIDEVAAPGRQIAIFGERGVGKTSLAALAYFFVAREEKDVHFVRCTKSSTFDSIFAEVLTDAGFPLTLNGWHAQAEGAGMLVVRRIPAFMNALGSAFMPGEEVVNRPLLSTAAWGGGREEGEERPTSR